MQHEEPPYQNNESSVHYALDLQDLNWLCGTMMHPESGDDRKYLWGLCVGWGSFATTLGHTLRAVATDQRYTSNRPVLTPQHVITFVALNGLLGPVRVEVNEQGKWAALHDLMSGQSVYAPLRDASLEFPAYYHLTQHTHAYKHAWGATDRMLFGAQPRGSFIDLKFKRTLRIDAHLLQHTPDGYLCYSPDVEYVTFIGDGIRTTAIALFQEEKA
jgi:hypothetical protein